MGKGITPTKFKHGVAERLYAARVGASYPNQEEFARALGCGLDAYRKYEQGRTLFPAHYLPRFQELTGKDANYLYGLTTLADQKRPAA